MFVFLGFAGSSCRGPLWKPVLARRLKCRCRLPAGFVPPTCTVFLLHIKCICKSCFYFLLALHLCICICPGTSHVMLCRLVQYCWSGLRPARAGTNYCRRSWEKLNSGHTFEFRPKNWVVLGNGTLGWPNFGEVLRNRDESAFSMTWEDLGWRESWDGSGGWCWWVGGCCLSELRRPLVRIWWTRPGSSQPPVRTCNIFIVTNRVPKSFRVL